MRFKKRDILVLSILLSFIFHLFLLVTFLYFLKKKEEYLRSLPPLPKQEIVDIVTLPKPKHKVKKPSVEKHKVAANVSKKGRAKVYSKIEKLPFGFEKKGAVVGKTQKQKTKEKKTVKKVAKQKPKQKKLKPAGVEEKVVKGAKSKKKEKVVKIKGGLFKPYNLTKGFLAGKSKQYEYKNSKREATISIGTQSIKYASYLEHIKNKIQNVWVYPQEAVQTGQQGRLLILFSIDKNGNLVRLKLIRSSGYPLLDKAALQAVRDASPFPALPKRFNLDVLNIYATFEYDLGLYFIQ